VKAESRKLDSAFWCNAAVVSVSVSAQQPYRLADIVARWPAKTREHWQQEEWQAGRWVKLVLDTING
jgi:hypothetical protein